MIFDKTYVKLKEAVKITGLSEYYLRRGCRSGEIPSIRCGNVFYVNLPETLEKLRTLAIGGGKNNEA